MNSVSEKLTVLCRRTWVRAVGGVLFVALCATIGSCVTFPTKGKGGKPDRGFLYSHSKHYERALDDCSICHDVTEDGAPLMSQPAHDLCKVCHEIPDDPNDKKGCELCHVRPDFTVSPHKPFLSEEINYSHKLHLAKEIACLECHKDVDKGWQHGQSMMTFCMDCHAKTDAKLNECSVCHKEVRKDRVPQFLGGRRIAHDTPAMWERIHGRESRANQEGCKLCHDLKQSCDACHSKTPPDDHTLSWRRRTHGLRADWNRERCAACHEEDFCIRCHKNTTPSSHRAGWGHPLNRHCTTCHYPVTETNCTVCHQDIEHERAMPSPHNRGLIPPNCGLCHPMGLPHRAPHLMNSTAACVRCHP